MACLRLKIIEDVDNDNDEDNKEEDLLGFVTKEMESSGFYEICGLLLKPPMLCCLFVNAPFVC